MKIDEEMAGSIRQRAIRYWMNREYGCEGYDREMVDADFDKLNETDRLYLEEVGEVCLLCAGYRMALNDVEKAMEQVLKGGLGE